MRPSGTTMIAVTSFGHATPDCGCDQFGNWSWRTAVARTAGTRSASDVAWLIKRIGGGGKCNAISSHEDLVLDGAGSTSARNS